MRYMKKAGAQAAGFCSFQRDEAAASRIGLPMPRRLSA